MDFTFTVEEEAFRTELKEFYRQELPPDWHGEDDKQVGTHRFSQSLRKKVADKGWLTMSWPKAYGGQDAPITKSLILAEESTYHNFMAREQGVGFLGPAIIQHGTEEQKKRFLEPISRAELTFHQGFSEPDAGSDLAGLRTRADRDGDFYVINGQKIWGGNLKFADYSFLLARTNQDTPKHKGISLLIIPADTPGLRYEEFGNLGGGFQNIAYYDNCRVPVQDCLVGDENGGWYVAMSVLNHERVVVEYSAMGRRLLEDVIAAWKSRQHNGGADLVIRNKLAQVAVEIQVARMLAYRIAWLESKGEHPSFEASEFKIFGGEMMQRFSVMATNLLGLYGQIQRLDPHPEYQRVRGRAEYMYRHAISFSLIGGANEIQRGVIASRGLGLPRS